VEAAAGAVRSRAGGLHSFGGGAGVFVHGPRGTVALTPRGLTLPTGLGFDAEVTALVGVALSVALLSLLLNVLLGGALLALWLAHWRKDLELRPEPPRRQVDVALHPLLHAE